MSFFLVDFRILFSSFHEFFCSGKKVTSHDESGRFTAELREVTHYILTLMM